MLRDGVVHQVAEHLLYDLPGVVYRRSIDEVKRHHVKKFDVVMTNYSLSELCTDDDRQRVTAELWNQVADGGVLVVTDRGSRYGNDGLCKLPVHAPWATLYSLTACMTCGVMFVFVCCTVLGNDQLGLSLCEARSRRPHCCGADATRPHTRCNTGQWYRWQWQYSRGKAVTDGRHRTLPACPHGTSDWRCNQ